MTDTTETMASTNGEIPAGMQRSVTPLELNVSVGDGPDGTPWVYVTFADYLMTCGIRLPAGGAEKMAPEIAARLLEAAAACRQNTSPLQVATDVPADVKSAAADLLARG